MITKLKRIILTVASVVALGAPALVTTSVYAQNEIGNGLCSGANLTFDTGDASSGCATVDNSESFTNLLRRIINIFSIIVGVIAVIMIIIGGLKYITSGGDSGNVSGAKNTIIYAIVGLVVVALAQFIVHFVLTNTQSLGG